MENSKEKIDALNGFKASYLKLLDLFDNESMCENYPFNESFDEIDIIYWVENSIENIKTLTLIKNK